MTPQPDPEDPECACGDPSNCAECSAALEAEILLTESLFWHPVDEHGAVYGGEA